MDRLKSSYRDPDGFVFTDHGQIKRAIHSRYFNTFDHLNHIGFYQSLQAAGLLIAHSEMPNQIDDYRVIIPEPVNVISYPYEWSFSQFKDAALATLEIQRVAIENGATLKDASAYNIQFQNNRPVLIDTLSFEIWDGEPWLAYKQFCENFLAPLALMAKVDLGFGLMLRTHLEGVPLGLASRVLSWKSWLNFGLLLHLHLHASSLRVPKPGGRKVIPQRQKITKAAALGLVQSLRSTITQLQPGEQKTYWANYYTETNYAEAAMEHKRAIVRDWVSELKPECVWDIGANDGSFSLLVGDTAKTVLSLDIDANAVDANYLNLKKTGTKNILPLIFNIVSPSPSVGWRLSERLKLEERSRAQVILALALIHHLVLTHNIPLQQVAEYFAELTDFLIIEFVPRADSQVEKMLALKTDSYDYSDASFEMAFASVFNLEKKQSISSSERTIYLFRRKDRV